MAVPAAASVKLKSRADYRIIERPTRSVDTPKIVGGEPLYAMDVQLPGMKYAAIARSPALRGKPRGGNFDEVRRLPGVLDLLLVEGQGAGNAEAVPFVAVIANSTWAAFRAKRALKVDWDTSAASQDSWSQALAQARKIAGQRGAQVLRENGDLATGFSTANKTLNAFYSYPFLAHATMEPQVTTAWFRDGKLDLWAPAQTVDSSRPAMARLLGLPLDQVAVHLPRIGGGFGRRLMFDFMTEAALIAKRVSGPVKLVWTREDDLQYDYYRVGGFHGLKAALDSRGQLTAWQQHFVTYSSDGKAPVSTGGIDLNEFPLAAVTNTQLTQTLLPLATRTGPWRAPRSNGIAFAQQCFLHEAATAAKRDHVEFLVELFNKLPKLAPQQAGLNPERAIAVIKLAADKAGWGKKSRAGRGLGLAFYYSHAGHVAEVVDLTVDKRKQIKINRVTVAGDIGLVVNPLNAEHQVVGSVTDGLSAALGQQITIENGAVQQSNFHQYPLLRMPSAPPVSVHFVDSGYAPTGVGEPALPPLAPALCNAIFAATGVRVRELPLALSGFSA
jgi:isoquinoline 1-oxidoreductase beta subunit